MPLPLQPKLLRVLEDGRVRRLGGSKEHLFDVRLVAATNQDPRQAVREGRLREDLYYRLNVFTIHLPPLRERGGDLRLLTQHFLGELNRKHQAAVCGLRDETLKILRRYRWPGNVRELRNVMERAVVVAKGEWIEPSHLPPYVREPRIAHFQNHSWLRYPMPWLCYDSQEGWLRSNPRGQTGPKMTSGAIAAEGVGIGWYERNLHQLFARRQSSRRVRGRTVEKARLGGALGSGFSRRNQFL